MLFIKRQTVSLILLCFCTLNFRFTRGENVIDEFLPKLEHLSHQNFGNEISLQMQNLVSIILRGDEVEKLDLIVGNLTSNLADSFLHGVCQFSKELNPLNWINNFVSLAIDDPLLNGLNGKINKFLVTGCLHLKNLVKTTKNSMKRVITKFKLDIAENIEAVMTEIFTDVVIIWINNNNNPSDKTIWTLMKIVTFGSGDLPRCEGDYDPYYNFWQYLIAQFEAEFKGLFIYISQIVVRTMMNKLPIPGQIDVDTSDLKKHIAKWQAVVFKVSLVTKVKHRMCDPNGELFQRGRGFLEMKGFNQRVIYPNDLDKNCGDIDLNNGEVKKVAFGETCKGRINYCWSYDSITACRNEDESDPQRYKWFQAPDTKIAGKMTECNATTFSSWKMDQLWGIFKGDAFCLCRCAENKWFSDRSTFMLSKIPVFSDFLSNKIVVGVQFEEVDHIIYMKVQQAELKRKGRVKTSSLNWVKQRRLNRKKILNELRHQNNRGAMTRENVIVLSDEPNMATNQISMSGGQCSDNQVITGVRFNYLSERKEAIVGIEVKCCNMTSEKSFRIDPSCARSSSWTNELTKTDLENLSHLSMWEKNSPLNVPFEKTQVDSNKTHYIKFVEAGWADGGQTTVPLLDSRIIPFNKTYPTGISLYHRGTPTNAGFIGFVLTKNERLTMKNFKEIDNRSIDKRKNSSHL